MPYLRLSLLAGLTALISACAPLPPRTTLPVERVSSPNYNQRAPNFVILHHTTDNTANEALQTLTNPLREVSAHYLVKRDGGIVQLVEENMRAWHAGQSWWGGLTDLNSASLGIELDNNGIEPFSHAQIESLLSLLIDIRQRHGVPAANILAHADIAPTRKVDPSALFPWRTLAQFGFGLWCDAPWPAAPVGFDLALGLSAIGYAPATPEASRSAFRLRYFGGAAPATEEDEKALAYCLLQKKIVPRP